MTTRKTPLAATATPDADDALFVASLEKGMRVLDAFRDASD